MSHLVNTRHAHALSPKKAVPMSKLLPRLDAWINTHPNDDRLYLLPRPGNRQPSVMHQHNGRVKIEIRECHRRVLEAMKVFRDLDRHSGVSRDSEGGRTVTQLTEKLKLDVDTVRGYLNEIESLQNNANFEAGAYIIESSKELEYRFYRIWEGVVFAAP
jgi:DNA-binding transcriptional ArsR family regulator